jgi:hypothetical protein
MEGTDPAETSDDFSADDRALDPADIPAFMKEALPAKLPSTTESSRQEGAGR